MRTSLSEVSKTKKQTRNKTVVPKLYEKPLYEEIPSRKTCVHLEQTEMS